MAPKARAEVVTVSAGTTSGRTETHTGVEVVAVGAMVVEAAAAVAAALVVATVAVRAVGATAPKAVMVVPRVDTTEEAEAAAHGTAKQYTWDAVMYDLCVNRQCSV